MGLHGHAPSTRPADWWSLHTHDALETPVVGLPCRALNAYLRSIRRHSTGVWVRRWEGGEPIDARADLCGHPDYNKMRDATARAENHNFWLLSAVRAYTKAP